MTEAEKFLPAVLQMQWDPAALERVSQMLQGIPADGEQLVDSARRENLAPLLYQLLQGKGLLCPHAEAVLKQEYYLSAAIATVMLEGLEKVLLSFGEAGIPVLVIKGASLGCAVYNNPALRPMTDLDLLVRPADFERSNSLLLALGGKIYSDEVFSGIERGYSHTRVFTLTNPSGSEITVDLHWSLLEDELMARIPLSDLFEHSLNLELGGCRARMPSYEDHFVYLCGHIYNHPPAIATSLLALNDLALLAARGLDWNTLLERALAWGLLKPLQHALGRLHGLWPDLIHSVLIEQAAALSVDPQEEKVHRGAPGPGGAAWRHLKRVQMHSGLGWKIRYLLRLCFPTPAYMRRRYCPQRPAMWPLAYFLRLSQGCRDYWRWLSSSRTTRNT